MNPTNLHPRAPMVAGDTTVGGAQAQRGDPYAPPEESQLPRSDVALDLSRAALLVTDPQNDFLSETGVAWDVVLQLRKRHIDQVILAGMSANLCVESHLRHLLEHGFQVAVVKDAVAAAQVPEGDGYLAALINFRFIANGLWSTDEAVRRMK